MINDPSGKYIWIGGATGSSYISDNYFAYPESNGDHVRILEKVHNTTIDVIYTSFVNGWIAPYNPPTIYPGSGTFAYIDVSLGGSFGASGAPMSYYSDTFMGYFNNMNISVKNLNDDEDIPIGYPIVLHNDTFDITWDDANVTFNQVDQKDPGVTGPYTQLLYSQFNNSYNVSGWTSTPNYGASGATYVSIPVTIGTTGFPSGFPNQDIFSWINL
jgi:hypothetical protein